MKSTAPERQRFSMGRSLSGSALVALLLVIGLLAGCDRSVEAPKTRDYTRTYSKVYVGIGAGAKSYVMTETVTVVRPNMED